MTHPEKTDPDVRPTRRMPWLRLVVYYLLASWTGSLTDTAWNNFDGTRWFPLGVNLGLIAGLTATVITMLVRDVRRGRVGHDDLDDM